MTVAARGVQPEGDLALMEHAEHALALLSDATCVMMPRTGYWSPLGNPALASRTLADFVRKHGE